MKKLSEIAAELRAQDFVYILTHKHPDGDTLGSAYALCSALKKMGKTAKILCNDAIPKKFAFMKDSADFEFTEHEFEPKYIISVDISDTKLLGENLEIYSDKIDLSIDHHVTHKNYAKTNFVDASASANCEIIYDLLCFLIGELQIDEYIAACLYTGIATDTGCFLFPSTTAKSHEIAAKLIKKTINIGKINERLFIKKSKALIELERLFCESIKFFCGDKIALGIVELETLKKLQITSEEIEGLSSIPMRFETVQIGITVRQIEANKFKVSFRTNSSFNATAIAEKLNGGGHLRAAGCELNGTLESVLKKILDTVQTYF